MPRQSWTCGHTPGARTEPRSAGTTIAHGPSSFWRVEQAGQWAGPLEWLPAGCRLACGGFRITSQWCAMIGGSAAPSPAATPTTGHAVAFRTVTVIMTLVIGLTFLFGFGNVWLLALRLGVPGYVAPLVAPSVDLSVLGLLVAIRELAVRGAPTAEIQAPRRLLVFASLVTLALNVSEPLIDGRYAKAAFDAVGPLLLMGWAEVGVRHEVVLDRVEVEGLRRRPVAAGRLKLGAA